MSANIQAKFIKDDFKNFNGMPIQYMLDGNGRKNSMENSRAYDVKSEGNVLFVSNGEETREIVFKSELPAIDGYVDARIKTLINMLDATGYNEIEIDATETALIIIEKSERTQFVTRFTLLPRKEVLIWNMVERHAESLRFSYSAKDTDTKKMGLEEERRYNAAKKAIVTNPIKPLKVNSAEKEAEIAAQVANDWAACASAEQFALIALHVVNWLAPIKEVQIKNKIAELEQKAQELRGKIAKLDTIVNAEGRYLSSKIAGGHNYKMGKGLDREMNRRIQSAVEAQGLRYTLNSVESRITGLKTRETHLNGQLRADRPSKQKALNYEQEKRQNVHAYLKAHCKAGDEIGNEIGRKKVICKITSKNVIFEDYDERFKVYQSCDLLYIRLLGNDGNVLNDLETARLIRKFTESQNRLALVSTENRDARE